MTVIGGGQVEEAEEVMVVVVAVMGGASEELVDVELVDVVVVLVVLVGVSLVLDVDGERLGMLDVVVVVDTVGEGVLIDELEVAVVVVDVGG